MFNDAEDISIGKVLSAHGVGGYVKVFPYSDFPDRVKLLDRVELILGGDRRTAAIEKAMLHGRYWLVKFEGITNRSEAALLNGSLLVIPRSERMPLPEDLFYHDQLIGLKLYTEDGELLGQIVDIISTGGHDQFQVERSDSDAGNILVPAVKKFIRKVDLKNKRMIVELPEGLLEL